MVDFAFLTFRWYSSPILKTARFSKFFGWGGDIPKNKLDECEGKLGMGNYTNDIPVDEGSETLYAEDSEIWNILKMKEFLYRAFLSNSTVSAA